MDDAFVVHMLTEEACFFTKKGMAKANCLPLLLGLTLSPALLFPATARAATAAGSPAGGALLQALVASAPTWAPVLLSGAVYLLFKWRGDRARRVLEVVEAAAVGAYHATTEWAAMHPGEAVDKVQAALGFLSERLRLELARAPTDAEVMSARMTWTEMHGQEKALASASTGLLTLEAKRLVASMTAGQVEAALRAAAGATKA
jgi:hypothetical protein